MCTFFLWSSKLWIFFFSRLHISVFVSFFFSLFFSVFFTSSKFFVFSVFFFLVFTIHYWKERSDKKVGRLNKKKKNKQLRMIFASDGVGVVIRIKSAEIKIQWKNNSTNGPRSGWKRSDSSNSDYVELLTLPMFNIHYGCF